MRLHEDETLKFITVQVDPHLETEFLIKSLREALGDNTLSNLKFQKENEHTKPWITLGLLRCMPYRDNLHKKLKKDPENEVLELTYRRYRNF